MSTWCVLLILNVLFILDLLKNCVFSTQSPWNLLFTLESRPNIIFSFPPRALRTCILLINGTRSSLRIWTISFSENTLICFVFQLRLGFDSEEVFICYARLLLIDIIDMLIIVLGLSNICISNIICCKLGWLCAQSPFHCAFNVEGMCFQIRSISRPILW